MKRANDIAVGPNFRLYEFEDPSTGTVRVAPELVDALELVRRLFGAPIKITSGYRSLEHNAAVGGAQRSEHIRGRAADLVPLAGTMDELHAAASKVHELLAIHEGHHVHVELRRSPLP